MLSGAPKELILAVKLIVGLGLLVVLLMSVNTIELIGILKQARLAGFAACTIAALLVFDFQGLLLGIISGPFAKIPHKNLFAFTLIGRFFSLILPSSIGGDVVKIFYLLPYFQKRSQAYAAILMHRALGGIATLLIGLVSCSMLLPEMNRNASVIVAAALLLGLVMILLGYYKYKHLLWNQIRLHDEKPFSKKTFTAFIYSFLSAMLAYDHARKAVVVTLMLSGVGTMLSVVLYMLIADTLGIPFSFQQAVVSATVTNLSVILPLTPGGIGVGEGTFVVTSGVMGVPAEQALAIMVLGRAIGYFTAIPGGVLYLLMPATKGSPKTLPN